MEDFESAALSNIASRLGSSVQEAFLFGAIPATKSNTDFLSELKTDEEWLSFILGGGFSAEVDERQWGYVDQLWLYGARLNDGTSALLVELVPVRLYSRGAYVALLTTTEAILSRLEAHYLKRVL